MNRGELWTVSSGVYAAKPRPAGIIQDDLFSATRSVVVIPLTATAVGESATASIVVPATPGTATPSYAMVDKTTTVRRSNLGARVGSVPATVMADIERSLMVFLGLAVLDCAFRCANRLIDIEFRAVNTAGTVHGENSYPTFYIPQPRYIDCTIMRWRAGSK